MSWVDDQYLKCERCGMEAGYSSYNCRTHEEYLFCTACGTSHNIVLERDEEGKAILKRDDYEIDGKISFIAIDNNKQLIESIPIEQTTTTDDIKAWGKKDSNAAMSRLMKTEQIDTNSYIIGIVNEDKSFTQVYGMIQVEEKDNKKIVFTEYYDYQVKHEDGYGVAKIVNENGSAALYAITEERTEEDVNALRDAAKISGGYFTSWDKEKNELVVEFGKLDLFDPIEDECCCCSECEGDCDSHHTEEHECKCGGSCGGHDSCGGNCSCH